MFSSVLLARFSFDIVRSQTSILKKWCRFGYALLILPCVINNLFAEGSKELSSNGGYRANLFSSSVANPSYPFPTLGTMKVYVKAGETINVGSSVQGFGSGTINLRSPDGKMYTSGNAAGPGLILNHSQELAGPLPNAGGYTPFSQKVLAGQDGIWEIDFISQSNGTDFGNPSPVAANAEWTQLSGQYIAAFDVSVRDVTNSQFLSGRVFTNVFSGILGTFNVGFNGIFNILTRDGYQYKLDNNGQAGNGFTFFVNNKGFRNAAGTASYQSVDGYDNPDVQDPRNDDTQSDITQKIFFNPPAADLPASAKTPEGTTWLLTQPVVPSITGVTFTGIEGTVGQAGPDPLGGNISFTASDAGNYQVTIDVNQNGIFTDPIDRKLTGLANAGPNQIFWDGLDGLGKPVAAASSNSFQSKITFVAKSGEVHFPFFDVERNINGIKLTRINGNYAPDDSLYWDDSPIEIVGTPSNPIKNLTGISSAINGHKWGSPASGPLDDADFGNNKSIDTWSYTASAPILSSVNFQLVQADLEVDTITAIAGCAGQPVIYNISVKNNGPNDVSGAKFRFNFPSTITDIGVVSAATTGTSAIANGVVSANAYNASVDLANGAIRTFTITGKIVLGASGTLNVSASITRPADVTDPDATNPDANPPTDANTECDAQPSGAGCNNIKLNSTGFVSSSAAGPAQTVLQYVTVNLEGNGPGTWTQAAGDPVTGTITSPTSNNTTVLGLDNVGTYHFIYTNPNDCADTVAITVVKADLTFPNVFTPNGDGKNDVFVIKGLESFPGSQLLIFNRWGNEVYRGDNYANTWDGSALADGTYFYVLNRREHNGSTTTFKGWVFLKRSK